MAELAGGGTLKIIGIDVTTNSIFGWVGNKTNSK